MTEMMIEKLYDAQDYNKLIRFDVYGDGVNIVITMVPDVMEVDGWYVITDKDKGSGTLISFRIDSDVEYDECGVYLFKSGKLTVMLGELN